MFERYSAGVNDLLSQDRYAAVDVTVHDGFAAAIDRAAEAADPRHAFLRAGWFAAAGGKGGRTLVAARPCGAVIAALPICRLGRKPVRAVPGSYWPYRSFPVAADASDEELVCFLVSPVARAALGPAWRLGPVYEDDPTAARLLALAPAAGWSVLSRSLGTDFVIDLAALAGSGDWPRGSTLKKNRYFEKQLAGMGEIDWQFVGGADWTAETFDALAAIEARSWVACDTDRSGAKFVAPAGRRLWEKARQDPVIADMMSAAILVIGGRPAAFSFDLDVDATKHVIANSYDQAFARHSPGRVLAYRNLARAAERGITKVDWGSGDGGYKSAFGAEPGPKILDLLFVRNRALAALLRPLWSGPRR